MMNGSSGGGRPHVACPGDTPGNKYGSTSGRAFPMSCASWIRSGAGFLSGLFAGKPAPVSLPFRRTPLLEALEGRILLSADVVPGPPMAPATVLSTTPLVFAAVAPGGAHAMLATGGGDLPDVGDGREFVFEALAGRRFDVLLETASAALQSTLEVSGVSGTSVVTADVAGESLLLSGLVVDGGPVTVTASAFQGAGAFTARVLVDGVFEREIAT